MRAIDAMTNRELAERIADAVLDAGERVPGQAADAVLDVLHETGHGFCRYTEASTGETVFMAMDDDAERMERVAEAAKQRQAELFGDRP